MAAADPYMKMKIDPQNLQIQTHTVEKLLEPLIIQVDHIKRKVGCDVRNETEHFSLCGSYGSWYNLENIHRILVKGIFRHVPIPTDDM